MKNMMKKKMNNIIGFSGRKRTGKTTLANFLHNENGYVVITIASQLKKLACKLMEVDLDKLNNLKNNNTVLDIKPDKRWVEIVSNETDIKYELIETEFKDKHFTTVREILQVVGTDIIRKYMPDWHLDKTIQEIESYPIDTKIVIDDIRFPNELKKIREMGGDVFFIIRPENNDISNHESETSITWFEFDMDHIIINSKDKEVFEEEIGKILKKEKTSLLLSNNRFYLKNAMFGVKPLYNEHDDFLQEVVLSYKECIKTKQPMFLYKPSSELYYLRFKDEIYTDASCDYYNNGYYLCENPLIIENLKIYC